MAKKRYAIAARAFDSKGRLLSQGDNSYSKSNTYQKKMSILAGMSEERIYLHAEVSAIIRAKGRKIDTLKVERFDTDGNPKLSFPCLSCQMAIKLAKIKRVIFTTEEGVSTWIV